MLTLKQKYTPDELRMYYISDLITEHTIAVSYGALSDARKIMREIKINMSVFNKGL